MIMNVNMAKIFSGLLEITIKVVQKHFLSKLTGPKMVYISSRDQSRRELCNITLQGRPVYLSERKLRIFCEANGIPLNIIETKEASKKLKLGTEGSLLRVEGRWTRSIADNSPKEIKILHKNLNQIKRKLPKYESVRREEYILVHMPVYSGKAEITMVTEKGRYKDAYFWCGEYRDIRIFLCGNKDNMIDDKRAINENIAWNPSGNSRSKDFFDALLEYSVEGDVSKIDRIDDNTLFSTLKEHLHKGTARGDYDYAWREILIRCDRVNHGHIHTIFGSPVFVFSETTKGYGWYYTGEIERFGQTKRYYELIDEAFSGRYVDKKAWGSCVRKVDKPEILDEKTNDYWIDDAKIHISGTQWIGKCEDPKKLSLCNTGEDVMGVCLPFDYLRKISKREVW